MNKEFIPYEEALALKELGFDEECFNRFYTKPNSKMFGLDEHGRSYPIKNTSKKLYTIGEHATLNGVNVISAPLYQQAFRFFRKKYKLAGLVEVGAHEFTFKIFNTATDKREFPDTLKEIKNQFNGTYEEAELACLRKLIETIKPKQRR